MSTIERQLSWSHGRFTILPTAGMLASAEFHLGERVFRPFARAQWMSTMTDTRIVGHLRELGGEFVGVPFGSSAPPKGMSEDWQRCAGNLCNETAHGPAADLEWDILSCDKGAVHMRLAYDEASPIMHLDRHIRGREGAPALDFQLEIHARRPARVAVGLHPIFRLPETSGKLGIEVDFTHGRTYPGRIPGEKMVTQPDREFTSLDAVPAPDGTIDLRRLPLGRSVEDVVLLGGTKGPAILRYAEDQAMVSLDWDRSILPSLMLWLSDRGSEETPLCGCYRGLGVEPLAAAFDLADAISVDRNPLNDHGIPTAVEISQDQPVSIRYSVTAAPL